MAAGDLITANHQYEYNGLLVGSGTSFLTESWDGLFDTAPSLRSGDLDRSGDDGVVPSLDYAGGRTIGTVIHLLAEVRSDIWALALQCSTAFQRRTFTEISLSFRHPITNGAIWQINCRPRNYSMPKDAELTMGHGVAALQLFASKPEFYNRAVTTSAGLAQAAGATTSAVTLNVPGNWPTGPTLTVAGPIAAGSTITVTGQTPIDGQSYNNYKFLFNTAVPAGSTVVIDMRNKTVTVNGTKKYSYKATGSDWWKLMPGNNTVTLVRAAADAAMTGSVAYQDAWLL